MDFDNALELSILLRLIKTSGVSSLMTYNRSTNDNVLFLYYSYRSKEEAFGFTQEKLNRILPASSIQTTATHMITKIVWGFEILCVIPIPNHISSDTVDSLLRSLVNRLKDSKRKFTLTDTEKRQIVQLKNIIVYGSETCIDNPHMSLLTVLTRIPEWQQHENIHHPLKYTMHSLRWLYNNRQFSGLSDLSDHTNASMAIKPLITSLNGFEKYHHQLFKYLPEQFSSPTLDQRLKEIHQQLNVWSTTYKKLRKNLQKRLINIRRGQDDLTALLHVISDEQYPLLRKTAIATFSKTLKQLSEKAKLIEQLNEDNILYTHILDLRYRNQIPITKEHIEKALRCSFLRENISVVMLYANDRWKHDDPNEWSMLYKQLISTRQQATQNTVLVYVDFSECQFDLGHLAIMTLSMNSSSQSSHNHLSEEPTPSTNSPSLERPLKQPSPVSVTEINVLLLGETGVGKSTFINAFVNYLIFDSLQQAEQGKPIVLIPVSFLMTVGDQFDEFTVKFGDVDKNENHEHQGQSVTQQCKSYLFKLSDKLHLRFIDTPGMGDTRGIDQDDKNIDHILTYINNLSHLNAICLLLKPNTSRLNIFFRSCIHELLTYLTPIGYNNIIFCFTNARSTFFAPGNTGPLLRKMLKQEHVNDVPFVKENTFCFDSESFRYLAARKCGVDFDQFQTEECIKSWTTSVAESKRLLGFIQTREKYFLGEWQSLRKCALEISMLARPLMETLRLILYNWKVRATGTVDKGVVLKTNIVTVELCTNCAEGNIVQVGPLWIVAYGSQKNNCREHCVCPADEKHFLLEYTIQPSFIMEQMDLSDGEFKKTFDTFLYKCDRLTHFIRQKGLFNYPDPFTPILERFLDEERQISNGIKAKSQLNGDVKEILRSIRSRRQQNHKKLADTNEKLSLDQINGIINELKLIPDVGNQIECIKTSRHLKLEAHECQVKIPAIKHKTNATLNNSTR